MRTVLSRRHGWTLVVLLVAAIAILTVLRLSSAAPPASAQVSPAPAAHVAARPASAPAAHASKPLTVRTSASAAAHRFVPRSSHGATVHATVTRRARAKRAPALHVPRAGRRIRTLTGTGARAIGSLHERTGVVLQWHATRGPFQIYTSRGVILVSGRGHHGAIGLARGDYNNLRVSTPGAWTIRLSRQR